MKQVSQSFKAGQVEVGEVPALALRPYGALVRTAWSLISAGTERAKVDLGQKSLLAKARRRLDQVKQVPHKVRKDGLLQTCQAVRARLDEQAAVGYGAADAVLAVGDRVACAGAENADHAEVVYLPAGLRAVILDGFGLQHGPRHQGWVL